MFSGGHSLSVFRDLNSSTLPGGYEGPGPALASQAIGAGRSAVRFHRSRGTVLGSWLPRYCVHCRRSGPRRLARQLLNFSVGFNRKGQGALVGVAGNRHSPGFELVQPCRVVSVFGVLVMRPCRLPGGWGDACTTNTDDTHERPILTFFERPTNTRPSGLRRSHLTEGL